MSEISPNRLHKIKEQLNNGKSHYGQYTRLGWMMNWWWIDSRMAVLCSFTCLLTCISEKFRKISRILFFRKTYNPN